MDLPGRYQDFKLSHNHDGLLKIFPSPASVLLKPSLLAFSSPSECLQMKDQRWIRGLQ